MTWRRAALMTVLCLPIVVAAQAPTRDTVPALRTGTATIRGRVVEAQTGRPLRGVPIYLYVIDRNSVDRGAVTDGNGRYEVRDVPAGRYRLTARKDGYLTLNYGQTHPNQGERPLVVADRQLVEGVDFFLPRGGVIAGALRDENNDPIANHEVRILSSTYRDGRRSLALVGDSLRTDDLGEFRIYGLSPGSFYVAAMPPLFPSFPPSPVQTEGAGANFAPTYYPGTVNLADAQRVVVKLGEVVSSIDFSLRPVKFGSISGTVLDPTGRALLTPQLSVRLLGTGVAPNISIPRVDASGAFTVTSVPPGAYELRVTGTSSAPERLPMIALTTVTLTGGETIDGLQFTATKMAVGGGRLLVDPTLASSLGTLSLQVVDLSESLPNQPRAVGGAPGRVQPDLTFSVTSSTRRGTLRFSSLPSGWYVKAIRVNGSDVSDSGIDFPDGDSVTGIEVELTNHPSQVSGAVRGATNERIDDYTVVVFARDPARRRGVTRYFGITRPDVSGTFLISGLPGGEYYAIALEWADPEASADPDFLEPLTREATPFTLRDGEAKSIDLQLVK